MLVVPQTFNKQTKTNEFQFYLVAHNLERSTEKVAIAIDNIRVAICDPRSFDPSTIDLEHSHEDAIYQNDPPPPPPLSESDIETTERR